MYSIGCAHRANGALDCCPLLTPSCWPGGPRCRRMTGLQGNEFIPCVGWILPVYEMSGSGRRAFLLDPGTWTTIIPSIPCRSDRSTAAITPSNARITLGTPGIAWQFVYSVLAFLLREPAAAAKQIPPSGISLLALVGILASCCVALDRRPRIFDSGRGLHTDWMGCCLWCNEALPRF